MSLKWYRQFTEEKFAATSTLPVCIPENDDLPTLSDQGVQLDGSGYRERWREQGKGASFPFLSLEGAVSRGFCSRFVKNFAKIMIKFLHTHTHTKCSWNIKRKISREFSQGEQTIISFYNVFCKIQVQNLKTFAVFKLQAISILAIPGQRHV